MISDLTIADSVSTLREYYGRIHKLHSDAHKPDYMLVHEEIKRRLDGCDSYTELGVNQGATLAAATLMKPSVVRAYDISLAPYNKAKHLFEAYAAKHSIDYAVVESDTLSCVIDPVDVLYIDTLHQYKHLQQELALHGDKAQKFIIFHDTAAQPGLKKAVEEFVASNSCWDIVTECTVNVGFMTIARK